MASKSGKHFREVEYTCSKCSHKQTIRYFLDDAILPVTCCVNCRAGFNTDSNHTMVMAGVGMFPGKPVTVEG